MNKLISLAIIGLVLFSLSTGCYNPFDQSDIKLSITGKVLDNDGKPLGDVLVRTDPMTTMQKTNSEGVYTINEVTPGKYKLKASKPGYKTTEYEIEARSSVFVCQNAKMTKDLMLEAQAEGEKTGEIYGTVKDKDGKTVKDVTITTDPATSESKTDTDGVFAIIDVKAGTYKIKGNKDGYAEAVKESVVVEGGKRTEIEMTLYPTTQPGSIKGKVTKSDGTGIEGVTITTTPATTTKTTDASGNYEITDVTAGDYTIKAEKMDYTDTTKTVTVRQGESADGNIVISQRQWQQLNSSPLAVDGHTAIWDSKNNRMIIFGGRRGGGGLESSLYDYNGTNWSYLSPTGSIPPARWYHSAVWDPSNNRMLILGGDMGFNTSNSDLWSFDGGSWTKLSVSGTPPSPRWSHSAVWDSQNNRMLIFGGADTVSAKNDLWSFNGTSWTQLTPTGTPPSARGNHRAIWDSVNNRMLVFGGWSTGYLNDLWSFNGTSWSQLSIILPIPSSRKTFCMIWDSKNNRAIIFSGQGATYNNDMWSFDGTKWIQLISAGTPPDSRSASSGVWDSANNRILIFGGAVNGVTTKNDLWSY